MRLLVIGGTIFLGRHLVEAALARGHSVTLFNRGRHNPDLFPEVEKLRGDRASEADMEAAFAGGGRFDAVVDTCGYFPRVVRMSAERLSRLADLYCFISSVSVYGELSTPGQDENAPLGTIPDPTVEEITGETYGPLKALCEQAVEAAFPRRSLVIRPGLIVGPDDPSDRFTYWPHRMSLGGDVLAPGDGSQPVQIIDVRDLAEWTVRLLENRTTGVYNAVGPEFPLTLRDIIETSRAVAESGANPVWVNEPVLREMGVGQWIELPLWIDSDGGMDALNLLSGDRALAAGLTFRPLATTVRDTLDWDRERPQENAWKAALAPDKERRVLDAWKSVSGGGGGG